MPDITLICSAHNEHGFCNADELLKILRALEPDVIFEEMLPGQFDSFYQMGFVEPHAITKYREFKSFKEVPVERYENSPDRLDKLKSDLRHANEIVKRESLEYQRLENDNDEYLWEYGFSYLNSDLFAKCESLMSEIEKAKISETNNKLLISALESWRQLVHEREVEMVRSIYEYCRKNDFITGVFLVGAAHKTSIVKLIEKRAGTEAELINWNFTYDGLYFVKRKG